MNQKNSGSGRRVLSLPAVLPSEDASPATLLSSLISLSRRICQYGSGHFSTNARNARDAIRHVANLLHFFDELDPAGLPDPISISLSELHLALQKIDYLLEDCTREGARLWMAMNPGRVAAHFRALSRSISTALDVLPVESLHVSSEAAELVHLVTRQTRRSKFEVGPEDGNVVTEVSLALCKFEAGVSPDHGELTRVLDHAGVRRWSDCDREVRFLEAMMNGDVDHGPGFDLSDEEMNLCSGLWGLTCYARCAVFPAIDAEKSPQKCENVVCINSDEDLRCPISLELMRDPVTVESGHTYDRSSILRWFRSGNVVCPKTGKSLTSAALVPNLAVKRLIQGHCVRNGISLQEAKGKNKRGVSSPGSAAAQGAMRLAAKFLVGVLARGTNEGKEKAVLEMRVMTKVHVFNRACLVEAGAVPLLLATMPMQDNVAAVILNLSKQPEGRSAIVENRGLKLMVELMRRGGREEIRQHAAATLFYLASVEEYRKRVGENPDAIPGLVQMVREGSERGKKNALAAIYGLLLHPGSHRKVLASGVLPLLIGIISTPCCDEDENIVSVKEEIVTDALVVLSSLAGKPEGAKWILKSNALPRVVEALDSITSQGGKEQCVTLLLALCVNGGDDVVGSLVKSASLIGSLYSVLGEGTSRGSKKASALIRILHEFYERSSSSSSGSKAPPHHHHILRERFVPAW